MITPFRYVLGVSIGLTLGALACLPAIAPAVARNAANDAAYGAALDTCVSRSTTYVEYQSCAADVDFRFAVADAQTAKDGR